MKKFTRVLFYVLVAELVLGGGGRLTAWGPVSLRMILFALALATAAIQFMRGRRIPGNYQFLLFCFAIAIALALIEGIYSGAARIYWWQDLKPLLYFLILPFFYFAIEDIQTIDQTARLFRISGIALAIIFFLTLILIHSGILPFLTFYKSVISTEEFFFRGEVSFTYKGFLFLCIGFLFIHFTASRYRFLWMGVIFIAIALTVTRGFWFALLATYSAYYFPVSKIKFVVCSFLALSVLFTGQIIIGKTSKLIDQAKNSSSEALTQVPRANLLGDRVYSDEGRFQQVKEVVSQITLSSVWTGHGFGNGTVSRPVHMEISYLEIFHKQGLLGIALWAYLFWMLLERFRSATPGPLRDAFFLSSLFVFIQSLTNQYINNPIGLSMILLSLVCLDRLKGAAAKQN